MIQRLQAADGTGGQPPEAAAASSAGAPLSNTAPANSNPFRLTGTRIVGAGIDSLYLSYRGALRPGVQKLLEVLKTQAQSFNPEIRALAQYPLLDWLFEVSAKGARMFSYVLADARYRIEFAKASSTNIPLAHVQVSSAALAAYGPGRVVADLNEIVQNMADDVGIPTVSRADLFVDVVTSHDISDINDDQWVTRAHGLARYSDQGRRSGYSVGRGGDVVLRLYDKPLEMLKSGKVHARRRWLENGWDGAQSVWRVELQLRRNVLRAFGVLSPDALVHCAGSLWHYGVEKWCRLAVPSALDQTRARWATHPFWEAITAAEDFETAVSIPRRVLRQSRAPSDDSIADRFIGALTDYMAKSGEYQAGRAIEDLVAIASLVAVGRQERTGIEAGRQVARKVGEKVRRFGTGAGFKVPLVIPLTVEAEPLQRSFDADE